MIRHGVNKVLFRKFLCGAAVIGGQAEYIVKGTSSISAIPGNAIFISTHSECSADKIWLWGEGYVTKELGGCRERGGVADFNYLSSITGEMLS